MAIYYKVDCDEMVSAEPPRETFQGKLDHTMGSLKELNMALDDTWTCLFGKRQTEPVSDNVDMGCMDDQINVIQMQANMALGKFIEIRKRLF